MKVIAIIQARMGSTRLSGKVLLPLSGRSILGHIVDRANIAIGVDQTIVATSTLQQDDPICKHVREELDSTCFRGSEANVLERFYCCAKEYEASIIIRLTADNPFMDPTVLGCSIQLFQQNDVDYLRYGTNLPLGMEVEVFSFDALSRVYRLATEEQSREHVTIYMYQHPDIFKVLSAEHSPISENYHNLRLTVDTSDDFLLAQKIYEGLYPNNPSFGYPEILKVLDVHSDWKTINNHIIQKKI